MSVKTLYNPVGLSKQELIESFVVRTKSFERIFEDIRSSKMQYPEKHYLIQGQRGMGKTTLLLRLKYEIENFEELNKWLLPVFFGEESYDLTSLSRLWEKLLIFLDEEFDTNGKYYDHTEEYVDNADYEKKCFDYLIQVLQEKGKKIILFFDNFGQLFLDNLKEKEKRRLREILMHCSDFRIIAASAIVLQDVHDYSEPFYEFFNIIHLQGLSKEETFYLIKRLQDGCKNKINLKRNKGKIETLSILTGGVIRTLMMVYQVLLEDQDGSALEDLEVILDQVTPLYKHRVEDLPVQQRRIVDVIAKNWDAISVKDIAGQIREDGKRIQTKLISAHLAQLEKNNVIEKKQTNTKNHLYQLKERFFNIWYLMRIGNRKDKLRVKWLTKFLELWYDKDDDINLFLERHVSLLKSGKYNPKSAILMAEALINLGKIDPVRLDHLLDATSTILSEDQKILLPDINQRKFALAKRHYDKGDVKKAIEVLELIKDRKTYQSILLSFFYLVELQSENAKMELQSLRNIEEEDIDFLISICVKLNDPELFAGIFDRSPRLSKGKVYLAKGEFYYLLNKFQQAEPFFNKALELKEPESVRLLASVYISQDNYEKAEKLMKQSQNDGIILLNELIEFYLFNSQGKDISVQVRDLLSNLPKDNIDYNFYKGSFLLVNRSRKNQIESIKKYFEKAIQEYEENDIKDYRYILSISSLLFFNTDVKPDKDRALKLIEGMQSYEMLPYHLKINIAFTLIWSGQYEKAYNILCDEQLVRVISKEEILSEKYSKSILLLLSRSQYHLANKLFLKIKDLKEVLKPTYYALMTLLEDEFPNEIVKMGEELKEPVNDMLKEVDEIKLRYN